MPTWVIILSVFGGLFSLAGAVLDWEWFITNYRAAVFVRILGRSGARLFYALLGLSLTALGLAGAFGLIPPR
jgi:small neutral amino acid transporter SnatA (MarC family)